MAKKDEKNRLVIPVDIWESVKFDDYINQNFAFFITNDGRVVITSTNLGKEFEYEFLGNFKIDIKKHRFVLPSNVDECLGYGDSYYFSSSTSQSIIYIYKSHSSYNSNIKNIMSGFREMLKGLDAYLEEDIDD